MKMELRDGMDFFEDYNLIALDNEDVHKLKGLQKYYCYKRIIEPKYAILSNKFHRIVKSSEFWRVLGFIVVTRFDRVEHVIVMGNHPNKNPQTNLLCIPKEKLYKNYDKTFFKYVVFLLRTYYLDNCFERPEPGDLVLEYESVRSDHFSSFIKERREIE